MLKALSSYSSSKQDNGVGGQVPMLPSMLASSSRAFIVAAAGTDCMTYTRPWEQVNHRTTHITEEEMVS